MNSLAEPKKWEKFFWPLLASALFLALWHYSVAWTATKIFPSPHNVGKGIAELFRKQVLWKDIIDSLRRVAIGFGAAAFIGIPLGLTLGWYPSANRVVNPVLQILRPISPIAWIPVAIILLGVGDHAATSLIFLGAFFPIVVACVDGVTNVPSVFRLAGRNFGLSPARMLTHVVFPAALPKIIVGFLVIDSRNSGKRYDLVVAAMLMIGLIGLILDTAFRRLEKIKSVRWGFRDES
jgi:NitT/TauT family transport system permease protein